MHLGLEKGIEEMEKHYYNQFPVITDAHVNEIIKLTELVYKTQPVIEELTRDKEAVFEYEIGLPEFIGYVDLMILQRDGSVHIYDFKYSNNVEGYSLSKQLHLYKYFLERLGYKVSNIGYVFIPKTQIKQKKAEDLYQLRKRIKETISGMEVKIINVLYDKHKVDEFFNICKEIESAAAYKKAPDKLCNWCEFQKYCEEGIEYMLLPRNEKRERKMDLNPDQWIYGDSYVGKSTFVDQYEDLLFINTDGNVDNITSPVVRITDEVTYEGRLRKEKLAWEVLLETITELEKKDNTFKRIAVDLVEDLYEHCRLYTYRKLGIDHEQDAGFGKGWDMVRTEFLSAMKRLKNLGYQIIFISKEINTEITLKNGTKLTTIKPNINDKVANVLTGIVDLTARAYMDGEERYLLLEKQENVFGGGRFNFKVDKVRLDKEAFIEALREAQQGIKTYFKEDVQKAENTGEESNDTSDYVNDAADVPEEQTQKARKSRRSLK